MTLRWDLIAGARPSDEARSIHVNLNMNVRVRISAANEVVCKEDT
jgi:hypothetical protein